MTIDIAQVHGLCGNMDGDLTNEFTLRTGVEGPLHLFGDSFRDMACMIDAGTNQYLKPCTTNSQVYIQIIIT